MPLVNTMVSFMPRWTRPPEPLGPGPVRHLWPRLVAAQRRAAHLVGALGLLLLMGLWLPVSASAQALAQPSLATGPAGAGQAGSEQENDATARPRPANAPGESSAVRSHQWQLQHNEQGLLLSARLAVTLSPSIEDALKKGLPLFFVWQADVLKERWYWRDRRIASSYRTLRLAYQPLTRRWRVSLHEASYPVAANELQYALHQNHDTLAEALAGVTRVANWRLGPPQPDADDRRIELRFKLDLTLLPRPWQIGMANQADWAIEEQLTIRVDAWQPGGKPSANGQ